MRTLINDVRFGLRLLADRPGFALVIVVTLALGIGVTTAMFSVIDFMYWRTFPGVADPGRLVELETVAPDGDTVRGSWLDYLDYHARLRTVALAAHDDVVFNMGLTERAKPVRGELVSGNYFEVLGVTPAIGRFFSTEEQSAAPGAHPVAVISHRIWMNELGGRPNVLGKPVRINRHDLTVIGVTPPEFRGAMPGSRQDLWIPMTMTAVLGARDERGFTVRSVRNVYMIGRLAPGASFAEARSEAALVARAFVDLDPAGHRGFTATVEPAWRSTIHRRAALLQPMLVLLAVSFLILAIVCANVANLLLARSVQRLREFGLRAALGAGAWRIARQNLAEALPLALAGSLAGIPLALWMTDSASLLLPRMARADSIPIQMDLRILAFAAIVSVGAMLLASLAPVLFVLRADVNVALHEGGRTGTGGARSNRMRGLLVVAEVSLALVVLIGAGLFYRSYQNANSIDPGFDRNGVLVASFHLGSSGYSVDELQKFSSQLKERLEPAPGITAVAYADYAPLWASDGPYTAVQPKGFTPRNSDDLKVHVTVVSPGYFDLLKIPLLEGRDFTDKDDPDAERVMLVDQAFARRFFEGASPVGREAAVRGKSYRIVGLVRDSKYFSYTEISKPHFYLPFRQAYLQGQQALFFIRTGLDPERTIGVIRSRAMALDPNSGGFSAAPLAEYNELLLIPLKLAAGLLAALGVIAFVLSAVGLYGVMSYTVSQRTRELGIRMVLGARPREVLGVVVRQGMLLAGAGVAGGLLLALASMRLLGTFLVGISPFDPLTFLAAALFLGAVAAIASFLPAHRATRMDPATALRSE